MRNTTLKPVGVQFKRVADISLPLEWLHDAQGLAMADRRAALERGDDEAAVAADAVLKPMATAPRKTILAIHFEKGPMEITPDHEANWWLAYKQPGVGHWFNVDDEESGSMDDGEFDGWIAESAE